MKRAFSLFELMVVIILLSIVYALFLPKLNFSQDKKEELNLSNLKTYLLKQKFENELQFACVDDSFDCFIFADGKQIENKSLKNFFKSAPDVYTYDKKMKAITFLPLKFDTFEEFKVVFSLRLDNKKRHQDMVVQSDSGVFVYNSMFEKVNRFEYLNDVVESIELLEKEVKNAF